MAGLTDGDHFSVRGGIIGQGDLIHALSNDIASLHNDRAEGPALARVNVLDRKLNGSRHKGIAHAMPSEPASIADSGMCVVAGDSPAAFGIEVNPQPLAFEVELEPRGPVARDHTVHTSPHKPPQATT